ncbi:assimilatory sulfite reductase (NADPH) flavoprotein subunit [Cerasicoccus arenae]|uniref:assimilatory sulfite reductase (NADPH) n=1 Tax=Cerasicoccus arenae TaxID=424488 RepID=A0A8J3D942_9BACT|nr:assimilatory sulfite reductase (NADPH) flavoprotein subunit [Cerasicoccus arenae]MBK1856982.1 assimilatory sulfite reductase (NADPH) flavoprotein subunit [Cerasicoccus arenae]GHB90209.1 sulfite reductase [NADPH] flavoprotein alpha-component [Cerasicoccus arenae]
MIIPSHAPFSEPQRNTLNQILPTLSDQQTTWLSGFLAGAQSSASGPSAAAAAPAAPSSIPLTILYGTESGNCEELAAQAKKAAAAKGFAAKTLDMGDIKAADLAKVKNLLVIVSTWGDGEPPDRAVIFYEQIMGDQAPKLDQTHFSVLALGDTSYEKFCQIGKDFDARLEALGAKRFHPRTDCDLDYEGPFKKWLDGALQNLGSLAAPVAPVVSNGSAPSAPAIEYGKKNHFPSELKERVLLNGRGSIKETIHLELSLAGSGLTYDAGDALAVVPSNCPEDITAVIEAGRFKADDIVPAPDGSDGPLNEVLAQYYDITGLTKNIVKKYNELAKSDVLTAMLGDKEKLQSYLWGRQVCDLLTDYPIGLPAKEFVNLLRKMPPRLYSIASSMKAHPDEVHLTVAAVRYDAHGRARKGVASTYLADRVAIGETIPVYTHHNKNFKLPANSDTPIIMIGPGTGIAPFRSFIEDRAADGAKGKNWLFFGDQRFSYDFLYQLEWQDYLKDGLLTKLNTAFSRDQPQKIYVQQRMIEEGKGIYDWLQDGAHFYVCGDASRMAHDVNEALITIYQTHGGQSREDAEATVKQLQKDKRYQRDVY